MSWLSKVSDFAGAAENLLNKLDEKTGDAIQQARDAKPRTRKSSSASIPAMSINMPESVVAEEFGRTTQSIPSRAQSDYVGSSWKGKNNYDHSIIQPGETATTASESWSMVLNSNDSSVKPEEDSKSQKADCDANLKSQLWAKESQITVIKSKLAETERKLEKRNQEYYELKAEKQILENRLENQNDSNQEIGSIQELKVARKMAQSQKEKAVEECNSLKRKIVGFEEEIRAMVEQLRLAKFNLNENKKEFDEYKTKAQKILNAKEKLVESLKLEQGIGTSDRPVHLLQAEVEEIKVERDFVKSDLESAQLQIYNLRSDAEDLEVQIRDLQTQLNEEKRNHLEEKQSWETSMGLLNEKIECFRIENEFTKQEMKRQNDLNNAKLQEKNNEIRKAVEEAKARLREEQALRQNDDSHSQLGEMLLQKQQELEDAQRSNQVLSVRLDRLQKAVSARETSISMEYQNTSSSSLQLNNSPSHSFLSNIKHTQTRQALQAIDSTAFKLFTMLRNYPSSRLFFVFYFIIMHLWLFFILITYTPEIH